MKYRSTLAFLLISLLFIPISQISVAVSAQEVSVAATQWEVIWVSVADRPVSGIRWELIFEKPLTIQVYHIELQTSRVIAQHIALVDWNYWDPKGNFILQFKGLNPEGKGLFIIRSEKGPVAVNILLYTGEIPGEFGHPLNKYNVTVATKRERFYEVDIEGKPMAGFKWMPVTIPVTTTGSTKANETMPQVQLFDLSMTPIKTIYVTVAGVPAAEYKGAYGFGMTLLKSPSETLREDVALWLVFSGIGTPIVMESEGFTPKPLSLSPDKSTYTTDDVVTVRYKVPTSTRALQYYINGYEYRLAARYVDLAWGINGTLINYDPTSGEGTFSFKPSLSGTGYTVKVSASGVDGRYEGSTTVFVGVPILNLLWLPVALIGFIVIVSVVLIRRRKPVVLNIKEDWF